MNKKATAILMLIFELLAVILVISRVMAAAKSFGETDTVIKINTAENLRMMVDTLTGVPGEAVVEYPDNVSKFIIILDKNGVIVFKEGELEVKRVIRNFILPTGYTATGAVKNKEKICLEKKKENFFLRECTQEETKSITEIKEVSSKEVPPEIKTRFEEGFLEKVKEVSRGLEIDPNYLLAVIYFETGGTFSPSQKNMAGSGATGLIQFMPETAKSLGTTTEELAKMSQVQQMDYVKKYFELNKGRELKSLSDVYMVVLYPSAIGKPEDYTLFKRPSKAYELNAQLDLNKDQIITKQEASSKVMASYQVLTKEETIIT